MTIGYIERNIFKTVEKIIKQNDAEIVDFFEGCLLDNSLYQAKRGMFALYEQYATSNSSKLLFKFARTKEEINDLWNEFIDRRKAAEMEE